MRQQDGKKDRLIYEEINGYIYEWMARQKNGQACGQADRGMVALMEGSLGSG